ncbi:MAG: type II secretion system protein M [Proteobacteria bacterium]|nr:type II secretion system protein M [Pseudomonadota bacterium]
MTPTQPRALAASLRAKWADLAALEQTLVLAAAAVLGLALLWWLLLAPALAQLRTSPARHEALNAELRHMQTLQAEALRLRDMPRAQGGEARRALQGALAQQLGAAAQINIAGDRATVTLKGAAPEALAQWLAQVRSQARAVPVEARLVKNGADSAPARWDGTLVLALPPG